MFRAALFAAFAVAHVSGLCAVNLDCGSCASSSDDCGWCPFSGTCLPSANSWECPVHPESGPFITESDSCVCADPAKHTSCASCQASFSTCNNGWCPSTAKCLYGDENGPADPAACPTTPQNGTWTWGAAYCECVNPAQNATSCTACLATADNCNNGWCPSLGVCLYNDDGSAGPASTACPATASNGSWVSEADDCVCANPEATATTCDECLATIETCNNGWCPSSGKCLFGNEDGPSPDTVCDTTPANGTWTFEAESCACGQPLSNATTCSACLALSDTCSNNGWCPSTGQCLYGGNDGPATPMTCPSTAANASWAIGDGACACINPATTALNCTACEATIQDCNNGWCSTLQTCMYGDEDGPAGPATCNPDHWAFGSGSCPSPSLRGMY